MPINQVETLILSALRKRPMTAPKIAEHINKHPHTVRNAMNELKKAGMVVKGPVIGGYRTWKVAKYLERERPYLKSYSKTVDAEVYVGMEEMLSFLGVRTKSSQAVDNFPVYVSKLLMIGFKYNTIKENWAAESHDDKDLQDRLKPLRRELRDLRADFDSSYRSLSNLFDLLTQLAEHSTFWDLESLGNHFNKQLNFDAELIPPVDSNTVVEVNSRID